MITLTILFASETVKSKGRSLINTVKSFLNGIGIMPSCLFVVVNVISSNAFCSTVSRLLMSFALIEMVFDVETKFVGSFNQLK